MKCVSRYRRVSHAPSNNTLMNNKRRCRLFFLRFLRSTEFLAIFVCFFLNIFTPLALPRHEPNGFRRRFLIDGYVVKFFFSNKNTSPSKQQKKKMCAVIIRPTLAFSYTRNVANKRLLRRIHVVIGGEDRPAAKLVRSRIVR